MCQIWLVKKKGKKERVLFYAGICKPIVERRLPLNSSRRIINKTKSYKKKISHLFNLYLKQYREFEGLLVGLLDMVRSLEHHYANHSKVERRIIKFDKPYFDFMFSAYDPEDPECTKKLLSYMNFEHRHERGRIHSVASYEASAYLNRLGQIEALFKSDWFQAGIRIDINEKIPTIVKIVSIRHKVTAHRRQDVPWEEDIGFLSYGMNEFRLEPLLMPNIKAKHVGFMYWLIKEDQISFQPSLDHIKIVKEIFDLSELFLRNLKI